VEKAEVLAPEGVGTALLAGRHDVPTFGFHSLLLCAPTTPPPIRRISIFENTGVMGGVYTRGYGTARLKDFRSVPELSWVPKTRLGNLGN
jgi:hypothetical protein